MFDDSALNVLLPTIVDLAQQAAQAVLGVYDSADLSVEYKSDDSPVTAADLAANRIIINGLRELSSNIPIVSEESLEELTDHFMARTYWLVDPVDGTKEFISHNGEFTVNVGLIQNGMPVLGVVVAPALSTVYFAARKAGSYKVQNGGKSQRLTIAETRDTPLAGISRSHLDDATRDWLQAHGITQTLPVGSSLKLCYVADNRLDVVPRPGPMSEWDIAAADAVLREAGGAVYELESHKPYEYGLPLSPTRPYVAAVRYPD